MGLISGWSRNFQKLASRPSLRIRASQMTTTSQPKISAARHGYLTIKRQARRYNSRTKEGNGKKWTSQPPTCTWQSHPGPLRGGQQCKPGELQESPACTGYFRFNHFICFSKRKKENEKKRFEVLSLTIPWASCCVTWPPAAALPLPGLPPGWLLRSPTACQSPSGSEYQTSRTFCRFSQRN